ncbi:MAG: hypothetical protein LV480_01920 [Methylacidiphilales bacterium]|nr:hypothetical protein [Candidatus Methylacidiphilales bacterium]
MNNKRISLTRIVAIHWYGFRQIFDVSDDILISGVFGSGKSALLDLMQYVMLGENWRANRAAAGSAKGRDLRSYCLCDTNTVKDGEPHYTRRSAVTIVALEFSWPLLKGEEVPRRETWGIRIEYSGPTSDPKPTYFCVPERMTENQFMGDGKLLDDEDFRTLIRREYGHDFLFPRQKDYLEEMSTPNHLYFDRDQLNKTMWKSIAFEPEQDIEKFIRDFILEDSPVDVRDVKTAVSAYRDTLARLQRQESEAVLLREVSTQHQRHITAQRSFALAQYLATDLEYRRLAELVEEKGQEIKNLDTRHASDNAEFTQRTKEIETLNQQQIDFRPDADESELLQRKTERQHKNQELSSLRDAQQGVRSRLKDLAQYWRRWLRQGEELRLPEIAGVLPSADKLLEGLAQGDESSQLQAIPLLAQKFNDLFLAIERQVRPFHEQLRSDTNRLKQLAEYLEKLEKGETPGAFPLFRALRERTASAQHPVEQLCRLVEVTPAAEEDGWRPALEMFLGRNRFAIVTGTEDQYRKALDLIRPVSGGERFSDESLVHPREALELRTSVEPNSLATKVEIVAPDPEMKKIAQTYVHFLLGQVIAVDSIEDLDRVDRGISREGVFKQKPIRRRLRSVPGMEYTLGREGLKRLRQSLLEEQSEAKALRDAQQEKIDRINHWVDTGKKAGLGELTLPDRSNELYRLPLLQKEIEDLKARIEFLSTPEREERLRQLDDLRNRLSAANQALGALRTSREGYSAARKKLDDACNALTEQRDNTGKLLLIGRQALPIDISVAEIESEVTKLLEQKTTWKEKAAQLEERKSKSQIEAIEAKNDRQKARQKLVDAVDSNGRPCYPEYRLDFDILDDSNERWEVRLLLLEEAELPKYRQQAVERRKDWERRLRDQVLNRLNEHLSAAERTVKELRRYLDRTVGRSRYRITQRRDPAFSVLWSLLESGFEPTDELLAASRNAEIQTALDELMAAVEAADKADDRAKKLLDYRYYHRYDIEMVAVREGQVDAAPISLSRRGSSLSGGENQAPFFISTLAAFRRVYDKGDERSCHLGLVVMDEAFSKLSGDGVEDCLDLARNFNLQLVMAFPIDRLGVMAPFAQTIVVCKKEQEFNAQGYVSKVDNYPILLSPDAVEQSLA